jgi:hypothetical protein
VLYHNGFLFRGDFFRRGRLRAGNAPAAGESPAADAARAAGSWGKGAEKTTKLWFFLHLYKFLICA